jgi:hypothetical protein
VFTEKTTTRMWRNLKFLAMKKTLISPDPGNIKINPHTRACTLVPITQYIVFVFQQKITRHTKRQSEEKILYSDSSMTQIFGIIEE